MAALIVAIRRLQDDSWIEKSRNRIIYLITDARTEFDQAQVEETLQQLLPDPGGKLAKDKNGIVLKVM